jgi:hypothetical protein
MDASVQEQTLVCEECRKTFPAREVKFDRYYKRYMCLGCRRKLAAQLGAAHMWTYIKVSLIVTGVILALFLVLALLGGQSPDGHNVTTQSPVIYTTATPIISRPKYEYVPEPNYPGWCWKIGPSDTMFVHCPK